MSAAEQIGPPPWRVIPIGDLARCTGVRRAGRPCRAPLIRAAVRGTLLVRAVTPHAVPIGTTLRCGDCGTDYELEFRADGR